MRYKVIACRVLARELSLLSARSSVSLDVTWIRQGLHNYPGVLRDEIQSEIDRAEEIPADPTSVTMPAEDYAGIILGFGLCSGAVAGIRSKRLPLVLPRSHDCIGLLLGSSRRYTEEVRREPGTYWFTPGWLEEASVPSGPHRGLMVDRLSAYYGEDNATYLVELERAALADYTRATLIQWPELARADRLQQVRSIAADFGWCVETMDGDAAWLSRVMNGRWHGNDVAVARPGDSFAASADEDVVRVTSPADGRSVGYA